MFINGTPGFIDKIWLFFLCNSSGQRRRCLLKYDPSIFFSSSSYFYIEKNYQENKYFHQIQRGKEKVRNVYNTSENCPKFLFCFYNLFRTKQFTSYVLARHRYFYNMLWRVLAYFSFSLLIFRHTLLSILSHTLNVLNINNYCPVSL